MGWPLILALASSAAEQESKNQAALNAEEDAEKLAMAKAQQEQRKAALQREIARRSAMSSTLQAGAQPLYDNGLATREAPEATDPRMAETLAALAKYGGQYGSYLENIGA